MDKGYIKLDRKFKDWEWKKNPRMVAVFVHLLLEANYQEKDWKGKKIPRGDLITSIRKISEKTGLSIQQTKTCISNLQLTNEITIKTTNKYTQISIVNWDKYQVKEKKQQTKQQAKVSKTNKQITNKLTTTKEYKEYKEYLEEDINKKIFDNANKITLMLQRLREAGYDEKTIGDTIGIFDKCKVVMTPELFPKVFDIMQNENVFNKDGYAYELFKREGLL